MCDPKPTSELERFSIDFSRTGQEEYIFKIRKDHVTVQESKPKLVILNQIHNRFIIIINNNNNMYWIPNICYL